MKDLLLAIESSCDDSSIAIVSTKDLSCCFYETITQDHSLYGGVVPELAARLHSQALVLMLKRAEGFLPRLAAIAVSSEPGLMPSLASGVALAKSLALGLNLPLISTNHLMGHIYSLVLEERFSFDSSWAILLVSGAHSMLLKSLGNGSFKKLCESLDDSFGESFDKVARMLYLGYPGGPLIEKLAKLGNENSFPFTVPLKREKNRLEYSFSGIKNQARLFAQKLEEEGLLESKAPDLAASFQKVAAAHLLDKLELALRANPFKKLGIVGGASANLHLREKMQELCLKHDLSLHLAPLSFCSDNARMIARAALEQFWAKDFVSIKDDLIRARTRAFDD